MIDEQEARTRFWTRLCLALWAIAVAVSGISALMTVPTMLLIVPIVAALAVVSTIRLLFLSRSFDASRTRQLLLELSAEVEELKRAGPGLQ